MSGGRFLFSDARWVVWGGMIGGGGGYSSEGGQNTGAEGRSALGHQLLAAAR